MIGSARRTWSGPTAVMMSCICKDRMREGQGNRHSPQKPTSIYIDHRSIDELPGVAHQEKYRGSDFLRGSVAAEGGFLAILCHPLGSGELLVVPRFNHPRHDGVGADGRGKLAGQCAGEDLQTPL